MQRDYAIYPKTPRGDAAWLRDTALPWGQVHPRWHDAVWWGVVVRLRRARG